MSVKIKVAVIGKIKDGVLIRHAMIMDPQYIVIRQLICNPDIHCSWKSLVSVRAVQKEGDALRLFFLHLPQSLVCEIPSAMQRIDTIVIFLQQEGLSTQCKTSASDPVGASSHRSAKKAGALFISRHVPVSKHHIPHPAVPVRHHHPHKRRPIVCHLGFQPLPVFQ